MQLNFELKNAQGNVEAIQTDVSNCIVAGWAGRDRAAIEHHIEELAEIGVKPPSQVPLFYRVANNQLTQESNVQVVGTGSSGEVEVLVFNHQDRLCISITSDHTDRVLEAHSVALSKQICIKPTAKTAWFYDDVADHWDQLQLEAWIIEEGEKVAYQKGSVSTLLHPLELIEKHFNQSMIPRGAAMTCGTVAVIGSIRPATEFFMALFDPVLKRRIEHRYTIDVLPEVE